jgi:hypothetical protein
LVEKLGHATQYTYGVCRGLQFVFSRQDVVMDTAQLNQYVGNYEFGISIVRTGNSIYATVPNGKIQLHAETNDRFYVNGVPGATVFTIDHKGKVTSLSISGDGGVMTAKKLN